MTRVGSVFPCVILVVCCTADLSKAGDELWAGGWSSDNVVRFEAQGGAFLGEFVAAGRGGLNAAHHFSFGPDGHFYVASYFTSSVMRYDGATGEPLPGPLGDPGSAEFVPAFSGNLLNAHTAVWGPDGNFYVSSEQTDRVNRYDGKTGAFIDTFISAEPGGLDGPEFIVYGPDDGLLYLTNQGDSVLRYDPIDGEFLDEFVTAGSGGLSWAHQLAFGADGHLYVASSQNDSVMRYDGRTGEPLPGPLGAGGTAQFVPPGSGGLDFPLGIAFGPDQNLYVASFVNSFILRYDGRRGAFMDIFANGGQVGLLGPTALHFFAIAGDGDLDGDGDIDLFDFAAYIDCVTGPGAGFVPPGCGTFDLDADNDVDRSDFGQLQLRFTGPCGITLTVHPEDVVVCLDEPASFLVEADGDDLSYQWHHQGEPIPGATMPMLSIEMVAKDDLGSYAVTVTDSCDNLEMSKTAALELFPDATILAQPEGGVFCTGDNIFLFVSAAGAQVFQWFKEDQALPGATDFFLSILDAGIEDSGTYMIDVIGGCNTASSEPAVVDVIECPPGP